MTEGNKHAVWIRRTADQDQVAQDSDLDTLTTVTSPSAAPSRFVHGLTTHYSKEGYHEARTPSDTNMRFLLCQSFSIGMLRLCDKWLR
jgi:hypothetical protein